MSRSRSSLEKGKRLQWNASDRIDWSLDLDPENPEQLPDETIPIFGSDVWERMTRPERANLPQRTAVSRAHGSAGWR